MTTIDTSPEAIAALAAEIARLTAAAENHNAAWVAACDRIAALEAERDEARALLAILYGEEGMGNVTPTDATAALAARDAAMRNEGRRQAAETEVSRLIWEEGIFCGQAAAFAETPFGAWCVVQYKGRENRWAHTDPAGKDSDDDWPTRFDAQAAAQADYEARILAALEPEGGE